MNVNLLSNPFETMRNVTEKSSITNVEEIADYHGEMVTWLDQHGNRRYNVRSYHTDEVCSFWAITAAKHWLCLIHMVKRPPARNPTDGQIKMYSPTPQELATIYG